jgi:TatD DNase family protein
MLIDCAASLVSRQFQSDRDRVVIRAKQAGVSALLVWFGDVEKQEEVLDICKAHSGFCYAIVGIHPNNIDKTNKKMHDTWLAKIHSLGLLPECVAIETGLNLSRETGTHFAQESVFKSCCEAALTLQLPLVLNIANDGSSLDRALELLEEQGGFLTGGHWWFVLIRLLLYI